jgi:hypothetical protein
MTRKQIITNNKKQTIQTICCALSFVQLVIGKLVINFSLVIGIWSLVILVPWLTPERQHAVAADLFWTRAET